MGWGDEASDTFNVMCRCTLACKIMLLINGRDIIVRGRFEVRFIVRCTIYYVSNEGRYPIRVLV